MKETLVDAISHGDLRLPSEFLQTASNGYARRLLHKTDHYAVVVMVWGDGQGTPIHDHDGNWCVECVYQGSIRVLSYDRVESRPGAEEGSVAFREAAVITAGRGMAGALIPPFDFHVIENPHPETAVTVHVYGGEMEGCDTYVPLGGGQYRCERRKLEYTS